MSGSALCCTALTQCCPLVRPPALLPQRCHPVHTVLWISVCALQFGHSCMPPCCPFQRAQLTAAVVEAVPDAEVSTVGLSLQQNVTYTNDKQ